MTQNMLSRITPEANKKWEDRTEKVKEEKKQSRASCKSQQMQI